jgi:hypothetical protein
MSECPFKPGVEVVIDNYNYGRRHYARAVVDKVYKNGNITLVGSTQQYRPGKDSSGSWSAWQTGDSWGRGGTVRMPTEEIMRRAAISEARMTWKRAVETIDRAGIPDDPDTELLERLVAIAVEIKAKGKVP